MGEERKGPRLKYGEETTSKKKKPVNKRWGKYKTVAIVAAGVMSFALVGGACKKDDNGNGGADAGDATPLDGGVDGSLDGSLTDGMVPDGTVTDGGVQPFECAKTEKGMAHLTVPVKWGQYDGECQNVADGCLTGVEAGDVLTFTRSDNTVEDWDVTDVNGNLNGTVVLQSGNAEIEVNTWGAVHIEGGNVQPLALTGRGTIFLNAACVSGNCGSLSTEVPEREGMALVEVTQDSTDTRRLLLNEGEQGQVLFSNGVLVNVILRRATAGAVYVTWSVVDGVESDGEPLAMPLGEGESVFSIGNVSLENAVSADNNNLSGGTCVSKSVTITDTNGGNVYQRDYTEDETFTTLSGVQFKVKKVLVELDANGNVVLANSAVKLERVSDGEEVVLYGGNEQHNVNGSTLTVADFSYNEQQPPENGDAGV